RDLAEALAKLPPKQAAAIVLRHYHGYTNRAIAQALGIPERTVASRLAVAKDRLRVMLRNSYGVVDEGQPGLAAAAEAQDERLPHQSAPPRRPAEAVFFLPRLDSLRGNVHTTDKGVATQRGMV